MTSLVVCTLLTNSLLGQFVTLKTCVYVNNKYDRFTEDLLVNSFIIFGC